MKFPLNGLTVIDVLCSTFPRSPRLIIAHCVHFIVAFKEEKWSSARRAHGIKFRSAGPMFVNTVKCLYYFQEDCGGTERPFIRISTHCDSRLVVSFILLKEASCCTNNKQIIHSFSARPFLNTTQSNENTHMHIPHTHCRPVFLSAGQVIQV